MGTKNLNENGSNPFFGGGTKNIVRVNLMAMVLFWHGFDNKCKATSYAVRKMKSENGFPDNQFSNRIFPSTRSYFHSLSE